MTGDDSFLYGQDPVEKIILRSMNEGVITLECNGDIFAVNPAALRILGFSEYEIRGRHFHDVFAGNPENETFRRVFEKAVQQDGPVPHEEVAFKRPDGQRVDLSIASSFLILDECRSGMESVVVVFRDITAFKSLERARMRALNHLSHEIKTPLAIIQASVDLVMRRNGFPENSRKPMDRIVRNVRRLTDIQAIVEEILQPVHFSPQSFAAAPIVAQTLEELRKLSGRRAVSLVSRLENRESDFIDPSVMDTCLKTLVKNAVENTPDGGEVIVSLSYEPDTAILEVKDFGIGIPISDQAFIFEAFHNTQPIDDYSTKEPFEFNAGGKGLELLRLKILSESCFFSVSFESRRCRYIPESHDQCPGVISACPHISDPGMCRESGGSTFSVRFSRS